MLRSLLQNSGWNLSGYLLPAVAAFAAIPYLFHVLGAERFGLLSLAWAVLGMVSVFDLGIGRAMTRWIAELKSEEQPQAIAAATATGLAVSMALGAVFSVVLIGVALATENFGLDVSPTIQDETRRAVYLLILGVWVTVYGSALRGGLEGFSDFQRLNIVKIPAGLAGFVLPCLTAAWRPDLSLAIAALVASRVAANIAMSRFLRARTTPAWTDISLRRCAWLVRYGGWITVSSLLGPIIVYADRFIVGYFVSAAAVSYVSVPSDALSRVLIVPVSMASAAFPAIVGERSRAENVSKIVRFATGVVAVLVVPATLLAALFAHPILRVWMGREFADASTNVFRMFAVGYGINALAQVPLLALQGLGSARATARWHLIQLAPYVVGLGVATMSFGVIGAATAWTLRATIDMLGMWGLLHHEIRKRR
jgi:O-antigen/teichoic acid export membrane protein